MIQNQAMPKVAIFIGMLLLVPIIINSDGFEQGNLIQFEKNTPIFDSGIVTVKPDFFTENNFKRYLIFGSTASTITENSIYGVHSDSGFFQVSLLSENAASNLAAQGYNVIEDFKLDFHSIDASRFGNITGSDLAISKYNSTGNGTVIGIVDTGVDFSNPDIQHSLARNELNHPIMFDPDGQGIVLTNATFFAHIDSDGVIRNPTKPIPEHMTSSVYVTDNGVFLDLSQGGKGSDIPIYNSFFPQVGESIVFNGTVVDDMKIGKNNRDYIKSQSGVYHLGAIYQGALDGSAARIQVVPVLVVDSYTPGVYDTIIPDLSTSFLDYTRFEEPGEPVYDFDFTDEKPIVLGSGKEFLVYDSDGNGVNDYSAGTIGAQVLDVYGAITNSSKLDDNLHALNGTLLPALDPDGEFFGVMTDFVGHGTSSAAAISSRGMQTYDIYNNSKTYSITGVAPDAKIIPIKALWFGDTAFGWLWAAGFENNGTRWEFSGKPKVDIISNSWGISNFPSFNASPSMDVLSLILGALTTPGALDEDFAGVLMVSSAGNSGHGYGTIGIPNASPFGITVGATTNNVFVGYGNFKDQPRFGNSTAHSNHVVDFSSRGPSLIGDPKPDVMSTGAYGFVPSTILKQDQDARDQPYSLFGGTSMSAPLVSGGAAILIEEMRKQSVHYDSFVIKNILMSTATDLNNDALTQGAGLVNVDAALDYVNGQNGVFIVYNDDSYGKIQEVIKPAVNSINFTEFGLNLQFPAVTFPMTSWFAGQLLPGDRTTSTFTINNPTNDTITVNVTPQKLSLVSKTQFNGTTIPQQKDYLLNDTDTFAPNYVKLSEISERPGLQSFFNTDDPIPDDSELLVLDMNFLFDQFLNQTADMYADDIKISSLYLYDWLDVNNDTKITSNELSMVNRAGSWGTVQELRVSEPNEKFDGVPLVGVYPVPTRYSYWTGDTKLNSTAMDYTLSASHYKKEQWSLLWSESETITIQPHQIATVDVTLVTPDDISTGVYQGFLKFSSDLHTVNAPVSFVIKQPVTSDSEILISGVQGEILYGSGYTKGAFDMANRYMAGDWRQYYFDIADDTINSAAIELSWFSNNTNLSVFVMNPAGEIIQTNVPPGVFGELLSWVSLDWLGTSPFSEGGGFFPVKNKNDTSTVLYVPINQTGTYTLLTHTTLFGGESTTEPITLVAKFTDIYGKVNDTGTILKSDVQSVVTEIIQKNNTVQDTGTISAFNTGIMVGIAIGSVSVAVFIFIIKRSQKQASVPLSFEKM